ncbi:MAG TPA: polymer-forming cytoskeletal protein [Burkholderiaceae bacterium]|nr:polymer-forming cytoskeletal protein [Burkholderiaceae bacterium]
MFSSKTVKQTEIASLIGATTSVTGDIEFSGGLRIDGTVKGSVHCVDGEKGGMLVISENGRIEGEVRAGHLVVAGRIDGPVCAANLIELQPKARISGDVRYRALEMHHGAVVEGMMIHLSADGKTETRLDARGEAKASLKLASNAEAQG